MSTPAGPQDVVATRQMPSITPSEAPPIPPAPALVAPVGDTCSSCGSPMATDQRYCISCGERRGDSRLSSLEQAATQPYGAPAAAASAGYAPPPAAPAKGRSQGLALLATIGLLLLAMGIGVLIGNSGGDSNTNASQQPIVIGGGGSTAAAGAATAAAASSANSAKKAKAAAGSTSDSSSSNADALAKKNGVKLAPKDATLGSKCDSSAVGCGSDGKFDGNYFGQ